MDIGGMFSAGALLFPLALFLLDSRGHSGCSVGTQVAASLEVPQLCSRRGDVSSLGLSLAILPFFWAHCGDIREFVAWRLL